MPHLSSTESCREENWPMGLIISVVQPLPKSKPLAFGTQASSSILILLPSPTLQLRPESSSLLAAHILFQVYDGIRAICFLFL
ncbi:hypothetical protein V6Z11_A11G242900 [Gossypium hirsutum]